MTGGHHTGVKASMDKSISVSARTLRPYLLERRANGLSDMRAVMPFIGQSSDGLVSQTGWSGRPTFTITPSLSNYLVFVPRRIPFFQIH